ncbi:hypothetical protein GY45DRAFT_1326605 [Cubamyces sp. BRFM 1775]|nr:hypothetical protein GY45DRAFT_1326605 [Cubamyces sp. BRFM 1775]
MGILPNSPFASANARPAISIHLPRSVFVSGCAIEGEVELDFRQLREDSIQEVQLMLQGAARTILTTDTTTCTEDIPLVRDDTVVWTQGSTYPAPGEGTLRIPFHFQLPPDLPPSYRDQKPAWSEGGAIRYSLIAVGARAGALNQNRRVRVPLAVVQRDVVGAALRRKFSAAANDAEIPWKVGRAEEKIRRGLWGDYAVVQAELRIPDVGVCPLFVPVPFVIDIKTISPPLSRAKAEAYPPDKPVFPPVPLSYQMLEFKLQQMVRVRAQYFKQRTPKDFVFNDATMVIDEDVPQRRWVPLGAEGMDEKKGDPGDARGTWVQQATFRSTFRLDCPHTFNVDNIRCEYTLELKVPFPGLGNTINVSMPIIITSGLDAPVLRDELAEAPGSDPSQASRRNILDLPPAYWDGTKECDDEKD